MIPVNKWNELRSRLKGDLFTGDSMRLLYATDASAYRELPAGVCRPKDEDDLRLLIDFAAKMKIPLIPRTAGTSLAGQVVGSGLVVDVSRYMTEVIELNAEERWVRVQPGVVLDELNKMVEPYGLFFGPETSTSNRCMIGGMVGNNSCGSHSLVYGSTRDHTLEIKALLSDGSEATFGPLSPEAFNQKCSLGNLEGKIYRSVRDMLADPVNQQEIRSQYPDPQIERRNTGYALDLLLDSEPFTPDAPPFNFCRLLAGSEGTLAFSTEIKLNLVPLPPKEKALICIHCEKLEDAFKGNLIALRHNPVAVELIDNYILERTKDNIEQRKNRFFIKGEPAAILVVELALESREAIDILAAALEADMRKEGYGYHFPVVYGNDINKVWALRKAGLGLLSNVPGDAKPVAVIEDTAVNPAVLPDYMADFRLMLEKLGLDCVFYAHIATGELHLRPVLNLKDPRDVEMFHTVALETAKLVKKYRGSLSGEHGDGRLRGEFIPLMLGEHNYRLLKTIKQTWDPNDIFNPGKITDTPRMNTSLRYESGQVTREIDTILDFSANQGILRAVEQCNGSGDCRKSEIFAGTMCPSYQATRDENATTRARANILREFLTRSNKENPFDHREIYEIMDLCLSCKGCKSECPSNVDIAKYKAEFLQHYYDANGIPLRTRMIAYITSFNKLGSLVPGVYNFFLKNPALSGMLKKALGFAPQRSIPLLYKTTLRAWQRKNRNNPADGRLVYLFADEFTNYNDVEVGISAIRALNRLGYRVEIPEHAESGRTFLSKGLLRKARKLAEKNIALLSPVISAETPLIGIEPSAILTFRDEYPDLTTGVTKEKAKALGANCLLFEDFIMQEFNAGRISKTAFTTSAEKIRLHGHCHQKSLAGTASTKLMLTLPENYRVEEIKSGCCGMAGSFGYEAEHYEVSMKVGELVLFPEVRKTDAKTIIAAPGTSCRHQISDGTGRKALHPVEIFYESIL
ncbi:FAD/FMN-containing dehydrogenase [Lentimicrobium saccharophilum]|uniref:FAD/FMN-containing dehydrogenase n=1 Tax=Lentimicrobium saccharophilum TaxID=1678841 RepID=A0A0S7C6A5_9BACT|nr:FAD-binding and (Fe-S)-binding domain-containing protein [Lentimicrobium saccharophilum]GAP44728.1 FAD/FMN-containing dehydrogenase [Lentimicrobium saccharophilum]